jgi:hypothetical protein
VNVVNSLYDWTDLVLYYGLIVLRLWALFDCTTRKAAAFPAVDKLTKPTWLAILVVGAALGSYPWQPGSSYAYPISLISIVAAAVYLADVRPAVREITSG